MSSELQVLIHAGELQQIITVIEKTGNRPVRGCLFGLWRNSMKQPVIQFVTDPGKATSSSRVFDQNYENKCVKILKEQHAMLRLGYWFCGSADDYPNVFNIFDEQQCNVLLFVSLSGEELSAVFYVNKDCNKYEIHLHKEDILPGDSSFRLSSSLTNAIYKQGAMYPCDEKNHEFLSAYVERLPSRTIVEPNTNKDQWYSSGKGAVLMQLLFQNLQTKFEKVEMSRDSATHHLQFTVDESLCLNFPVDFPNQNLRVSYVRDPMQSWEMNFEFTPEDNQSICNGLIAALHTFPR